MKKAFLSFTAFLFALAAAPQAHALVGGPFDNGDYSATLDNSGVYQAAFRFKNGSGFAQFGTNVDLSLFVDITNSAGASQRGATYSVLNRSLFYYKGVTFLGTATGTVDHEAKRIDGITNGSSDVGTTGVTGTSNQNSQSVTAATTTLINNARRGFPCNSTWTATITKSQPILRFTGTGELTVLNPNISQIAYNALQQLIDNYTPPANASLGDLIDDLVGAIDTASLSSDTFLSTLQATQDNSDTVQMTVFGSRQFFLGRR